MILNTKLKNNTKNEIEQIMTELNRNFLIKFKNSETFRELTNLNEL